MKKYKKIPIGLKAKIYNRILGLMFAGADWVANTGNDPLQLRSPNNPYYSQSFGIIDCLVEMGYGYSGAVNVNDEFNLRYWHETIGDICEKIVNEKGFKESYQWFCIEMNREYFQK